MSFTPTSPAQPRRCSASSSRHGYRPTWFRAAFVSLEALPVTPNGKVDRGACRRPPTGAGHGHVRLRNPSSTRSRRSGRSSSTCARWGDRRLLRPRRQLAPGRRLRGRARSAGRIASPSPCSRRARSRRCRRGPPPRQASADAAPVVALRSSGARARCSTCTATTTAEASTAMPWRGDWTRSAVLRDGPARHRRARRCPRPSRAWPRTGWRRCGGP